MHADFVVYDRNGRRALLVEAKARTGTSPTWATQIYNDLAPRMGVGPGEQFWLITPDRIFIFEGTESGIASEPEEIDAGPILAPYFEALQREPQKISGRGFEFVVAAVLEELIRGEGPAQSLDSNQHRLGELRDGRVVYEAAA